MQQSSGEMIGSGDTQTSLKSKMTNIRMIMKPWNTESMTQTWLFFHKAGVKHAKLHEQQQQWGLSLQLTNWQPPKQQHQSDSKSLHQDADDNKWHTLLTNSGWADPRHPHTELYEKKQHLPWSEAVNLRQLGLVTAWSDQLRPTRYAAHGYEPVIGNECEWM